MSFESGKIGILGVTFLSGGSRPSDKVGGRGVGVIQTLRKGGGGLKKEFFRPFGPQFGLKIRGVPGPPGRSPGSGTVHCRYPEDEGKSPHVRESKTTLDSGFHTVGALPGT